MRRLILACLTACTISAEQDVESEGWTTETVRFGSSHTNVVVLVVDDRPSADGIRQDVEASLRSSLEALRHPRLDPAAWWPANYVALVVYPSAEGSARFLGPSDVPALSQLHEAAPEGIEATLATTIVEHLAADGPAEPGRFRPLEATADLASLLTGRRPPEDAREDAILRDFRAAPLPGAIHVAIAAASDDESPLPVESYALPDPPENHELYFLVTASLTGEAPESCYGRGPSSRIGDWMQQVSLDYLAQPCAARDLATMGLFTAYAVHTMPRSFCTSHPIKEVADGGISCRMVAYVYGEGAECRSDRGWLDPLHRDGERRPEVKQDPFGTEARLCEVRQLEGGAREACSTSLDCEGCGSGFCRWTADDDPSMAPWESGLDWCSIGTYPANLRFVGGSVAGADALFQIVCDLDVDTVDPGAQMPRNAPW